MRIFEKIVLAVLFCGSAFVVSASNKSPFKKDLLISVSGEFAPRAEVKNTPSSNTQTYRWVVINVDVQTEKGDDKDGSFLDDVEMEIEAVLLNGKKNNVEQAVLFSGKIEYYFVELDGKKHNFIALIPGQLFYRYANKGVKPAQAEMRIQVKFYQRGRLLKSGYYYTKGGSANESEQRTWFAKFRNSKLYSVKEVPDSIFSRRETTWGMFDNDKYEFEKKQNK